MGGNFSFDKNGDFYSTTKIYGYIKKSSINESYLFWLGLLNSELFWYFIKKTGYVLRGGYFTFKTNYINPFPVPLEFNQEDVAEIEDLVRQILQIKKSENSYNTSSLEHEINRIIYKIYQLSDEEIISLGSY